MNIMAITFEQLPFVYQIETLFHVNWLGERGVQTPYNYQTLEQDLKQEALRIWQEEKYDRDNILKNLTPGNDRRSGVQIILERLLRYKRTEHFEDGIDEIYRDKTMMNKIHKEKQIELESLSNLLFPRQPYNFNQLKQEIAHLKFQELAPQVRKEREQLEQLITAAKEKAGASLERTIDLLLEAKRQKERATDTPQQDRLSNKIEAYQEVLDDNLTKEEFKNLLTKQTELCQLEGHLAILRQNLPRMLDNS